MRGKNKKIRYASRVVSRKDLEKVLAQDAVYRRAREEATKARAALREAEHGRAEIARQHTLALPEEKECSRLERAVEHTRKRLKELRAERDRQRPVAYAARMEDNRRHRREVKANQILVSRHQGELRRAVDLAGEREVALYQELYGRNREAILRKAGVFDEPEDEEEEDLDESLGLNPPEEEEEEMNA